ncbi:hypothetical protein TRVA0_066S00144 [Trichomonascus vanleenenianus]|uniref:uncharacterized protein n=1 Tax=Trichomonascus vanleenenianus TaxID=2268995 RepID=UPI003EC9838F
MKEALTAFLSHEFFPIFALIMHMMLRQSAATALDESSLAFAMHHSWTFNLTLAFGLWTPLYVNIAMFFRTVPQVGLGATLLDQKILRMFVDVAAIVIVEWQLLHQAYILLYDEWQAKLYPTNSPTFEREEVARIRLVGLG